MIGDNKDRPARRQALAVTDLDPGIINPVQFFFFTDTAPTEIYTAQYTLSLHDALPIPAPAAAWCGPAPPSRSASRAPSARAASWSPPGASFPAGAPCSPAEGWAPGGGFGAIAQRSSGSLASMGWLACASQSAGDEAPSRSALTPSSA